VWLVVLLWGVRVRTNGVALLDVELEFDFAFYGIQDTELWFLLVLMINV